jgi:hypothetical protein
MGGFIRVRKQRTAEVMGGGRNQANTIATQSRKVVRDMDRREKEIIT